MEVQVPIETKQPLETPAASGSACAAKKINEKTPNALITR